MSLYIKVPLIPPSVNHYAKHTRSGKHYVTGEAQAFKDEIALAVKGRYVESIYLSVNMTVTLGKCQKGDVDNFPKLVLDGLAACGAFRDEKGKRVSDAQVRHLEVSVNNRERPDKGYTEVWVS
jgi:crossover junction endodeoxyribonuclease RusA